MQPAAAEIERVAALVVDGPRPAAEPRPRLDQEAADRRLVKPLSGGNAGRAAADDDNFDIAASPCTALQ